MKAGEYMQIFKERYAQLENKDNFSEVDPETIKEIVNSLVEKIKEGKIYKGKAGENFRIYTSRLL